MSDYTPQKHLRFYSPVVKHMQQALSLWAKAEPALPVMAAQIKQWKTDLDRATTKAETQGQAEAKAALEAAEKAIPDRKTMQAHAQTALRALYAAADGTTLKADSRVKTIRAVKAAEEKTFIGEGVAATDDPFGKASKVLPGDEQLAKEIAGLYMRMKRIPSRSPSQMMQDVYAIEGLSKQVGAHTGLTRTQLSHAANWMGQAATAKQKGEDASQQIEDAVRAMYAALQSFKQAAGIDSPRRSVRQSTPTPPGDGIDTDEVSDIPGVYEMAGKAALTRNDLRQIGLGDAIFSGVTDGEARLHFKVGNIDYAKKFVDKLRALAKRKQLQNVKFRFVGNDPNSTVRVIMAYGASREPMGRSAAPLSGGDFDATGPMGEAKADYDSIVTILRRLNNRIANTNSPYAVISDWQSANVLAQRNGLPAHLINPSLAAERAANLALEQGERGPKQMRIFKRYAQRHIGAFISSLDDGIQ